MSYLFLAPSRRCVRLRKHSERTSSFYGLKPKATVFGPRNPPAQRSCLAVKRRIRNAEAVLESSPTERTEPHAQPRSRKGSSRACLALAIAFCSVWIGSTVGSLHAESSVLIELPADIPLGLQVVVPGMLEADQDRSQSFELSHPLLGSEKLLAQAERPGNRCWISLTATSELVGKPIRFEARPVEKKRSIQINTRDGGHAFLEGERAVAFYQSEPITRHDHTRAGFVHPLRGLDGEVFTEIFPADHRHHQGVFWAWHQLWVGDRKIGDPWVAKDHLVAVDSARSLLPGPLFTTLVVQANWTSPMLTGEDDTPLPIVAEATTIRLFRANKNTQYVDFTIKLTPLMPDVKIGGSENAKGYSGFTVRVKPPQDMVIQDASGIRDKDAVQTPSPWADVYGSFGEDQTSGVAILSHPSLAQFPPRWLLRHYGMQNVAYPGREPVALSADKPLVLRHRLVLHRGDTEQARISDHQRVFELTP